MVDTTYQLPAIGVLDDQAFFCHPGAVPWEVRLDEVEGQVEVLVSQMEGPSNCRRVPVGFSWCRRGCAKCSKQRGICKRVDVAHGAKRRARRSSVGHEVEARE